MDVISFHKFSKPLVVYRFYCMALFHSYDISIYLSFFLKKIKYYTLLSEEIACADPDKCYKICENKAGCANLAYPLLVLRVLPAG